MTLSITDQEKDFLLELLSVKRDSMLHELHHTDTNEYKELLKEQLEVLEQLNTKLENLRVTGNAVTSL
jgi:hypothetical protein